MVFEKEIIKATQWSEKTDKIPAARLVLLKEVGNNNEIILYSVREQECPPEKMPKECEKIDIKKMVFNDCFYFEDKDLAINKYDAHLKKKKKLPNWSAV